MADIRSDPNEVRKQYADASHLGARIALHARFSTNPYGWNRWVFDQLDLPARCRVLELGAGPGGLWAANAARVPPGWEIVVSDFSLGMVEQARKALAGLVNPIRADLIDAQDIPSPDAAFDAVIANHMLYHVPDRPRAVREMARVLRPGGRLFATTVGLEHMRELKDLVRSFDPAIDYTFGDRTDAFSLENGAEQLAACFGDIRRRDYDDALVVTEVEPLVRYMLSIPGNAASILAGARREEFRRELSRRVARDGAIRIRKSSGMFLATAPARRPS
jgi:SAM-dependent methyltransferase